MMVPVGRLVLLRSVPKSELVSALAYLTVPALMGPIIGPPLGGFITTFASWRWIFWINIPIGILGFVLVTIFIEDRREEGVPPLDLAGFLMTATGLTGMVFGFESAGRGMLSTPVVIALFALGAASLTLYAHYARRVAHPVIDLSLLRIPTFRASVLGGFLFRIGIGAVPFLLPLMLQEGFGLDPFRSGLITFATAVGSMTMKVTARPILQWLGFRAVLIGNALVSSAMLAAYGLFTPQTGTVLMLAVLLTSGYFRSLQFTSVNALAYADVPRERMSQATSFASMAQQLSLSVGVGTGALLLHITVTARGGGHLLAADFRPAFFVVGAIAAASAFVYLPLARDAGAEMSGRRPVANAQPPLSSTPEGD